MPGKQNSEMHFFEWVNLHPGGGSTKIEDIEAQYKVKSNLDFT